MNISCKSFGHIPSRGCWGIPGSGYFKVKLDAVDGIGRQHARLYSSCERCGVEYQVGMIHVPKLVRTLPGMGNKK